MGLVSLVRNLLNRKDLTDLVKEERCCRQASDYFIAINDSSINNPFVISNELVLVAQRYKHVNDDYEKARRLLGWFIDNIEYRKSGRYKNAKEVLAEKSGICADEAVLYITMARCTGLEASYVSVRKDNKNKKVYHACAAVKINKKWILIDPAYDSFDIKHKEFTIIADDVVMRKFEAWNS